MAAPPYSLAPAMPPLSTIVSYGLLTCLGRKAIFRPFLSGAFGSADALLAADALVSPLAEDLVVPPQAATSLYGAKGAAITKSLGRRNVPAETAAQ